MQVVLAEYGLGAIALYYLTPALLSGFVGSLRGFAGEVTAAQALDLLASDGSAVLIDIRTEVRGCAANGMVRVHLWQLCAQKQVHRTNEQTHLATSRQWCAPVLPGSCVEVCMGSVRSCRILG